MRKLPYLCAAAALSGLALFSAPGSATPVASGLATGGTAVPTLTQDLVQKVHGWHCRKRWSKRAGWHRHRRACYDDYGYYDDYDYYDYGYPGYGLGFAPFFGFQFFDDDDHHFRGHRFRGHKHFKRKHHKNW